MATIIGDCLLSSAFMAYAGYFDQSLRLSLVSSWAIHLKAAGIQFRPDLARVEVDCGFFISVLLVLLINHILQSFLIRLKSLPQSCEDLALTALTLPIFMQVSYSTHCNFLAEFQ